MIRLALAACLLAGCHWLFPLKGGSPGARDAELGARGEARLDLPVADRASWDWPSDRRPDDAHVLSTVKTIAQGMLAPHGLAVAPGGEVYVADFDANAIRLADKNLTLFASGLAGPTSVAIAGGNLYSAEYIGGKVRSFALQGGSEALVVSGLQGPDDYVLDSQGVAYLTEFGSGKILRLPASGGLPVAVASGLASPHMLGSTSPFGRAARSATWT